MTKSLPVPGCRWVAANLVVRTRKAAKLALPQKLLRGAGKAGVACVVNLLSKKEFHSANIDALFGSLADTHDLRPSRQRCKPPKVFQSHIFWPDADLLPSARQVRQALEIIEDAHAIGLRVLVNGVGHPARAALVAGCWLAREGCDGGNDSARRLGWLETVYSSATASAYAFTLNAAERTFVSEWPTGRENQPELVDLQWADQDEVFPFAPVEHWLRVLPTVRVYTPAHRRACFAKVPVLNGHRVSDGADIDLDADELRRGTWTGERTLRLTNGWEVVFVSSHR